MTVAMIKIIDEGGDGDSDDVSGILVLLLLIMLFAMRLSRKAVSCGVRL